MNIWTENKKLEKLNYMHHDPVKRGLVREPGHWERSSWRCYYLKGAWLLEVDRIP